MSRYLVGAVAAIAALLVVAPVMATADEWRVPTLRLDVPADTIAFAPTTIAVSGYVNEPGILYLRVSDYICPDPPGYASFDREPLRPIAPLDRMTVGPGEFSLNATWLPGNLGINVNSVCAWVMRPDISGEMASESIGVRSRRPAAALTVTAPRTEAEPGVPTTVEVSGSVEVARRLDLHYGDGCYESAAEYRGTRRITGESGVTVGPGAFSVTLPWAPEEGAKLCGYLSPPTELRAPDAKASATIDWVPPTVVLQSPGDGERVVVQTPRLRWEAAGDRRSSPIREDVLTLSAIDGRRSIPALRMTTSSYRSLLDKQSGKTSSIADVHRSSIKLKTLWPGTYAWTVARAGWRTPPAQRFTIVGERSGWLAVKKRYRRGLSSRYASVLDLRANAGVRFVDYRFSWRSAGFRWQHYDERSFDGRFVRSLWGSCPGSGETIEWRLTARDSRGTVKVRRGSFSNASAAECARLKGR